MPSARGGSGGAGGDEADATAEGAAGEPVDFAALGPGGIGASSDTQLQAALRALAVEEGAAAGS